MARRKKGAAKATPAEASEEADWVLVASDGGSTSPLHEKSNQRNRQIRDSSNESSSPSPDPAKTGEEKKKRKRRGKGSSEASQTSDESESTRPTEDLSAGKKNQSSVQKQAEPSAATPDDGNAAKPPQQQKKRKRRKTGGGSLHCCFSNRRFLTVFLLGALTALCVWLYIDLIIVAEEASKIRPFTERAAYVAAEAHHKAAEVAMKAQRKAAQAAEELQHSLDDISAYMEGMLFANKTTIDPTRPGLSLKDEMSPHFPVLMVPGVVSTGLEIWNGRPCALKHFRMRIWGTVTMMQKLLLDKQCWLDHVMLDKETGLDPEGIKLRAASGLEAADYLFPGYWVWGKLIQNFADIGYDSNNLFMAAYDWRLSFKGMQQRDRYFTKLKHMVELAYDTNNQRKVVLLTHSMGSNVLLYFLNWVQADPATNGGDGGGETSEWVDKYIESWVNIAGPMLGVPKALASLSSGEMRDTAQLGALETYVMENFFSRRQRAEMLRSWGSIASMLPKGGDYIWGNSTFAPDGVILKGNMISFEADEREETIEDEALRAELEREESLDADVDPQPDTRAKAASGGGSLGIVGAEAVELRDLDPAVTDPLTVDALVNVSSEASLGETKKSSTTREAAAVEDEGPSVEEVMKAKLKRMRSAIKKKKHKRASPSPVHHALVRNVTMGDAIDWMIKVADDPHFERYIRSVYSYGAETDGRKLIGPREAKYWSNPLESSLPHAPNMKIYCLYGVGKGAERAYVYKHTDLADELQQTVKEQEVTGLVRDLEGDDGEVKAGEAGGQDLEEEEHDVPFRINNEVNDPEHDLVSGVQDSAGDGTVPLMSLGYMCVEGWTREDYPYNPAGIKVLTREYPHQPSSVFADIRGGPGTADHVDILGNYEMTIDIMRLVSNQAHKVEERIVSPIREYSQGVDLRFAQEA